MLDAAEFHYYQVRTRHPVVARHATDPLFAAWMVSSLLGHPRHSGHSVHASRRTLVGSGLKQKIETRRPMDSLIPSHLAHIKENVASFQPDKSSLTTTTGRTIGYETLVVATGLQINWGGIEGLPKALADSGSGVSSIYSYDTCDKVWHDLEALRSGNAIFTQPAGVVKCAGGTSLPSFSSLNNAHQAG